MTRAGDDVSAPASISNCTTLGEIRQYALVALENIKAIEQGRGTGRVAPVDVSNQACWRPFKLPPLQQELHGRLPATFRGVVQGYSRIDYSSIHQHGHGIDMLLPRGHVQGTYTAVATASSLNPDLLDQLTHHFRATFMRSRIQREKIYLRVRHGQQRVFFRPKELF